MTRNVNSGNPAACLTASKDNTAIVWGRTPRVVFLKDTTMAKVLPVWTPTVGVKSTVHEMKDKKHSNIDGVQKALEERVTEMRFEGDHYCKMRGSHKVDEREGSLLGCYAVSHGKQSPVVRSSTVSSLLVSVYMVRHPGITEFSSTPP
jgi:hypothetical protein